MADQIRAEKIGHRIPMSAELAMDHGLIPDTRTPGHIPRRVRLRWRVRETIADLRLRLGSRIAGVDLRDWEP